MLSYYKNIKEAHGFYKYPGSYQYGSVYVKDYGIIRSYSNGKKGDVLKNNKIYYVLKNDNIKEKFKLNIKNKKKIRFFLRFEKGVKDMGLYFVKRFYKNFVVFEK